MTKKFIVAALPIVFTFVKSESGLDDVMELEEMSADKINNFGPEKLWGDAVGRDAVRRDRTDPNRFGQSDVPQLLHSEFRCVGGLNFFGQRQMVGDVVQTRW
jgi:hypothetical protein